jgi:outer membrane protein insertion porin family
MRKLKMISKIQSLIYIILMSVCSSFYAHSEIVKDIVIEGNERISDETVIIYGEIKKNEDYNDQKINEVLNNLYSTNFFKDVKIVFNNGVLKIQLDEYPIINQLIILGEDRNSLKEQIKKIIKSKVNDSFIENNLSQDIDSIKSIYSLRGYNFANVETKIREIDQENLDLVFEIDKGKLTKIYKINFTGDKKIREKRLRDIIASEEDKFWKFISRNSRYSEELVNLDLRLLENYYKSIGYYDVKITSNSAEILESGNINLSYSIDAGTRYSIKKIMINADPVFDQNVFYPLNEKFKKLAGDYYSPFKIKKLLEDIDELIEFNNLQFVEHNVEEIVNNDSISIKFNIYEGKKVLVERINILGNYVTNESVIRGELLLDEGDPFTNLGLDKSISKIKSRNIFKSVTQKTTEGSEENLKVIDITVSEQPTGEISAGAGIGTNGGSLVFNVTENNWLGEGKRVGFDVSLGSESLKGTVNYTNPNYDFLGNSLNYSVFSTKDDKPDQGYENTLLGGSINTSFEQFKNVYASLGVSATYDDLQTLDTASTSLKKQGGQFSEIAGNYGFSYDRRNRAFQPTDGSIVSFNQSLPIYADRKFISNSFSASAYQSITEDVVGAAKFYVSAVNGLGSDDVRLNKRKVLSSNRLRGFEQGKVGPVDGKEHVGGNYAAAINFEAALPNLLPESTKTDLGLFLDFANVWGVDYDTSIDKGSKLRSSTGVAASWLSPLGPMTFILATNISKASTDITESFNFNLGTTF